MNRAWFRAASVSAFVLSSLAAHAVVLWDNGPVITNPGAGAGGADASVVQIGTMGLVASGFGCGSYGTPATKIWVGDDFTIGAGKVWNLSSIHILAYQTGSGLTPTIDLLNLQIFKVADGSMDPTSGVLVFGDDATNRLSGAAFTNIYRVPDYEITNTQRPLMRLDANVSTVLDAGHYILAWHADGTAGASVWAPPVTLLGQTGKPGANAIQDFGGGWDAITDSGTNPAAPQDLVFSVEGVVPEPATLLALGAGALGLLARRRSR